jgi:hypothetical protein
MLSYRTPKLTLQFEAIIWDRVNAGAHCFHETRKASVSARDAGHRKLEQRLGACVVRLTRDVELPLQFAPTAGHERSLSDRGSGPVRHRDDLANLEVTEPSRAAADTTSRGVGVGIEPAWDPRRLHTLEVRMEHDYNWWAA